MTPKRLLLSHWCQHHDKEVLFTQGMNGIVGPNGTGKSNILEALNLALSLDTNNPGKLTDNIQDGFEKGSVTLEFEHDGHQGVMTLGLRRNYRKNWEELSLEIAAAKAKVIAAQEDPSIEVQESELKLAAFNPNEKVTPRFQYRDLDFHKMGEIQSWIRNEIGVETKAIKSNFFPRQGDVDGALSADRDTRQRVFHEKAGTLLCQKLWDELGKELRSLPDLSGVSQAYREAEARLAQAQGDHGEAQKVLAEARGLDTDLSGHGAVVQRYMAASKARQDLAIRMGALQVSMDQIPALELRVEEVKNKGMKLKQELDALAPHAAEAQQGLVQASFIGEREAQRTRLQGDITAGKARLQELALQKPQAPSGDPDTLRSQITTLVNRTQELKRFVETFKTGNCPTCGQEVQGGQEHVHRLQEELKASDGALGTLRADLASQEALVRAHEQAQKAWDAEVAKLNAKVAQAESTLVAMPPPVEVPGAEQVSRWRHQIEVHQALSSEIAKVRTEYSDATRALEGVQNQIVTAQALVAQIHQQVQGAPGEPEFVAASEALSRAQLNAQVLRDAEIAAGVAAGRVSDLTKEVARLHDEVVKVQPTMEWSTLVTQARDLLHRDALPAEVVAWYADQLVKQTLGYLKMFEADFSVIVNRDLGLMAVFSDKVMPADRLSGGQKNMLNISMRLAMADLFPSSLHLLVLDEVEVHLDQENVARLPILLEKVKGVARNRGLVVLFISHHPSLRDVSDHLIFSHVS